ncbi:orphan sodium- and chloride-dependent neurotransmitter transporter NTT5 [Ctenodactylus gundi]
MAEDSCTHTWGSWEQRTGPSPNCAFICSFFLVYLAMLLVVGTPLLFLEMAVGQRMQRSTMDMWRAIGPWAGGVGYTSFMVCLITSMYLNVFNAWIIFYLSFSFRFPVPWEKCALLKNSSGFDPECARTTPSMYFWYRQTLKVSDRIEVSEPPVWSLSLPFFISWCLTGAFLTNGLKSLGKVIGILILFPGIIILCFLIRGFMLEGAVHGLKHLLEVKVSTFYDLNVWIIAGCQVLFDLGLGFGPIASLSSHLVQSNNCLYDAIILTLASLAVRLFLMPCFLSVLGFWATIITNRCYEKNTETILMLIDLGILPPVALPPVYVRTNPALNYSTWFHGLPEHIRNMVLSKVPECSIENQLLKVWEGPRFAFLALVEVTSFMPASVLWSALFFVMLLNLGLGTTLGYMQGMVIPLQDSCLFFRTKVKLSLAGLSMLLFLGGLFFTRPAGIYFIRLLSDYWTILPIIVIVMCENLLVAWVYGARRFLTELRALLNCSIPHLCGCLWCYVTPSVLLGLLITIIFQIFVKPITYVAWDSETSTEVTRLYPRWSLILMLSLFLVVIIPIPGYIGYCLIYKIPFRPSHKNSLLQSLESPPQKNQIMPSDEVQRQEV